MCQNIPGLSTVVDTMWLRTEQNLETNQYMHVCINMVYAFPKAIIAA